MAKKDAPRGWPRGEWTNQALQVLTERYLAKDVQGKVTETPEGMCFRVAQKIAAAEKILGVDQKKMDQLTRSFYELMAGRLFLPNSPTLMNAGREDGLQYAACFVLPVGDSLIEIFDAVKKAALIHQSGGGTGFSFSRLRPKGSLVRSTRGIASGPVSFMAVFDAATAAIKQGGMRRGANMGLLRVDHPDILEFIESKAKGGITNFNISVAATDAFMKAVKNNGEYWLDDPFLKRKTKKLKAKEIFDKITQQAWQTGDPGMIFIDRVNAGPANPVPTMGPIEATNPCIVGSTLVATEGGLIPIQELVGKKMEIKILTDNRVLGKKGLKLRPHNHLWDNGLKEVWRLETESGFELLATPDHKIMTERGWVPLTELKPNEDKVLVQSGAGAFSSDKNLPFVLKNKASFPRQWSAQLGQVLGWLVGDGWLRQGDKNCRAGFTFSHQDKSILDYFLPILNQWYGREINPIKRGNRVWHLSYHSRYFGEFLAKLGVKPVKAGEKEVPAALLTAPKEAVIGFLQGLFSADGTVRDSRKSNSDWVALTSKSKKLLKGVQLLLLNLGVKSRIFNRGRKPREGMFPYRAKDGQLRTYTSDGILYELGIFGDFRERFKELIGFLNQGKQKRLQNTRKRFRRSRKDPFLDLVARIEKVGPERVYDLTEPVTHSVIINGIIGHQCGEQPLYPNEACNLGSINLSLMKKAGQKDLDWEKLKKVIGLATRFLDDVIEVSPFPMPEITTNVRLNRRVGLGVMGWADLLFQLEIPYGSVAAVKLARKLMKFIQKQAHLASADLALKRGPFPNFKKSIYKNGPPLRNATLTTIAPTGSISIIADCSSGIEPLFALAFKHKSGPRELTFANAHFLAAAKKYHLPATIIKEVEEKGTLGKAAAPEKIKKIFVTAHEISWIDHINIQAAFQGGTDNAVSKTINLAHASTIDEVAKAYLYAYQKGCLGITVYRDGCRDQQVLYAGKKQDPVFKLEIKPRPAVAEGKTYRVITPVGTAFVTVNVNGHNAPLEVFVNVGKVGSDIAADAEAIGRLISLNLRLGSGFPPTEVLTQMVDQLEGIGGAESVGFGKDKIRSLADGIAKVLRQYLGGEKVASSQFSQQPVLPFGQRRDLCPSCGQASLIFEENCARCLSCHYHKC